MPIASCGRPGLLITDMRLGVPVTCNQISSQTITNDDLLEMSKRYLLAEAKRQAAEPILPIFLTLALIVTLIVWRKRKR